MSEGRWTGLNGVKMLWFSDPNEVRGIWRAEGSADSDG